MSRRMNATRFAIAALALVFAAPVQAQQRNDEEYTRQIKQFLRDPRITTELVDHLPASATVPTPLKHFGHIMGAWGILDKAESMHAYYAALAKAATRRTKLFNLGKTEEGRDMIALAIASRTRPSDPYRRHSRAGPLPTCSRSPRRAPAPRSSSPPCGLARTRSTWT